MPVSHSATVTYSPAYTIVPTYECFNRCTYCNFRREPGQSPWMTLSEAEKILLQLQSQKVCEILILSGEVHPRSPLRQQWNNGAVNLLYPTSRKNQTSPKTSSYL